VDIGGLVPWFSLLLSQLVVDIPSFGPTLNQLFFQLLGSGHVGIAVWG